MNCIELSIENLHDECVAWAKEIGKEYQPGLLVYIAKGGFLIGQAFQEVFDCPLIGVDATRKGNKIKELLTPVLSHLPRKLLNWVRWTEMKSGIHSQNPERSVVFHKPIESEDKITADKILIVDDAIDTGYSMKAVKEKVREQFLESEIKLASLNAWKQSEAVIVCDYFKYQDTILRTPMSKDSKDYKIFLKSYHEQCAVSESKPVSAGDKTWNH